jgi:hypothetical protein
VTIEPPDQKEGGFILHCGAMRDVSSPEKAR